MTNTLVLRLRAFHVTVGGRSVPEVDRLCEEAAREIDRLNAGLLEIARMGEIPFNRQSVRAREIYVNDATEDVLSVSVVYWALTHPGDPVAGVVIARLSPSTVKGLREELEKEHAGHVEALSALETLLESAGVEIEKLGFVGQ